MREQVPAPRNPRGFLETSGKTMDRALKTVWMVDLKKAGERAECLWLKNRADPAGLLWREKFFLGG